MLSVVLVKTNNFDRIAWCYDFLARLIFGKNLLAAQCHFVDRLKPDNSVLILGGGNGKIVSAIIKHSPTSRITFIDASAEMIKRARQAGNSPTVTWICGTEEDIPSEQYDVIITPFFLDMFSEQRLATIISILEKKLEDSGSWLVTDFVAEAWWHRIYLRVMYRFFKITTAIEANTLPDWQVLFIDTGYQKVQEKDFYCSFIKSVVYQPQSRS